LERGLKIGDLQVDLEDGINLINLLELISAKQVVAKYNKAPKMRVQKLENCSYSLNFIRDEGLKLVGIGPEDIVDKKLKLILGLIWTLILRYHIQKGGVSPNAKNDLLKWVQSKIPHKNVVDFTNSWKDGTALCELVDVLKPGTIPNAGSLSPKNALSNATLGIDKAEEEMEIPKILAPEDMVADENDELSVMTYISYFRDYDNAEGRRLAEERKRKTPDPAFCTAFGPGLESGMTHQPAQFTIVAKNCFNEQLKEGGTAFVVNVVGNGKQVPVEVKDNKDGSYPAFYVPTEAGQHVITITLVGTNIKGSPWRANIGRDGPDPRTTRVEGPGLEPGNEAGAPAHFKIISMTASGKPVKDGGDPYQVKVTGPYDDAVPVDVKDKGDGTYDVAYKPGDTGPHKIEVLLDGAHVAKSPYHVDISTPTSEPDARQCIAKGPGLEPGVKTGEPARFTITAKNKNGDIVPIKDNPFTVEVFPPDESPVAVEYKNNGNGTVDVVYHPKVPGNYKIDVVLHDPRNPLFFDHIKNSPITVFMKGGADASKCEAFGPGLENGIFDNQPAEFKIQAKDSDGIPIKEGGDPFEVKVKGPHGEDVPVKIHDNDDGTYDVQYEPVGEGEHTVLPTLKGAPIKDAPFKVGIKSGADAGNTFIESFTFTIRAVDKHGKNKTYGGDKFEVKIEGKQGEVKGVKVDDIGDGTYRVSYKLPGSGDYNVNIKINGKHIKGSPWKQSV
jgi:filamin